MTSNMNFLKIRNHYLIVLTVGLLENLSYPPYNYFIFLPLCVFIVYSLYALSAQSDNPKGKNIFLLGFWYGLGKVVPMLYWLFNAFLIEGGIHIFVGIIFMILLFIILAVIIAVIFLLAFYLTHWLKMSALMLWFNFIIISSLFECFKKYFILSPMLTTDALVNQQSLLQMVSVIGSYGAHVVLLAFATSFYFIYISVTKKQYAYLIIPFITTSIMGAFFFWGQERIVSQSKVLNTVSHTSESDIINVRLVQYNIEQGEKWNPYNIQTIWKKLYKLSNTNTKTFPKGLQEIDLLIWPESALPTIHKRNESFFPTVSATLKPKNILLTGQITKKAQSKKNTHYDYTNSILAVTPNATVTDIYDKVKLVPLFEYIPYKDYLKSIGLGFIIELSGEGMIPGDRSKAINLPDKNTYFIPTVCYEAIFPDYFYDARLEKDMNTHVFLLNLSNDAWFRDSVGLIRLFEFSKLRAVENGLPYLRLSNRGISGVVDPLGRVIKKTDANTDAIIDIKLSKQKLPTTALFINHNIMFFLLTILVIVNTLRFFIVRRILRSD